MKNDPMIKLVQTIDIDSVNLTQWIWANRSSVDLATESKEFKIYSKDNHSFKNVVTKLKQHYPVSLAGFDTFRHISYEKGYEDYIPKLYIVSGKIGLDTVVHVIGSTEAVMEVREMLKLEFPTRESIKVKTLHAINPNGSFDAASHELIKDNQIFAKSEFYPWLDKSIEDFTAEFMASKSNVMIFIGPPGGGKSTLLRTMMFMSGLTKIGKCDNEAAIAHQGFMKWVRSMGRDSLLVIEDAAKLLKPRDKDNLTMSDLLNYTDGIVAYNTKIIISTNLESLSDVDEAILRTGRLHAVHFFSKLNSEQANTARAAASLPPVEFTEKSYSLAEVLNFTTNEDILKRRKKSLGFIS